MTQSNRLIFFKIIFRLPLWSIMVRPRSYLKFLFTVIAYLISQALGWQKCIYYYNAKLMPLYGHKLNSSTLYFKIPNTGRLVFPLEGGWIVVEIFVLRVYERFFKPSTKGTLIDIGAHAGSFSVQMSKKVKRIVAIEPNPRTYQFLLKNININHLQNVTPINAALSNKKGKATLSICRDAHVCSIMYSSNESVQVDTETLDNIATKFNLDDIDFLKIDAEGAEPLILQGGKRTIETYKPNIAMELHSQDEAQQIRNILEPIGYQTWCLRDILYATYTRTTRVL